MRIAFGGIAIEASNFSPVPSTLNDFIVLTGPALFDSGRYPFLSELEAEFLPTLFASALPGGAVSDGALGDLAFITLTGIIGHHFYLDSKIWKLRASPSLHRSLDLAPEATA